MSTDTLRARVEQAQALAAAAPAGPYDVHPYPGDDTPTVFAGDGDGWQACVVPRSFSSSPLTRARMTEQADLARLLAAAPILVALVTDLWAALEQTRAAALLLDESYRQVQRDRDEARKERDTALAEVARLRGEAGASASAGRELVWVQDNAPLGSWHLCNPGDLSVLGAPYSAWLSGRADAYQEHGASHSRTVDCAFLRVAVFEAANMARADGRRVPPHPLGWDVGVSDG